MMILSNLGDKLGPLPVWAWGGIAGGVVGAGLWIRRRYRTPETPDGVINRVQTDTLDDGLQSVNSWGPSPTVSGVSGGGADYFDPTGIYSGLDDLGYRFDELLNVMDTRAQNDADQRAADAEEANRRYEELIERQNLQAPVSSPAPPDIPVAASPIPPPVVVPAPSPPPKKTMTPVPGGGGGITTGGSFPAVAKPPTGGWTGPTNVGVGPTSPVKKGTVVWVGKSAPNMTTIHASLRAQYGAVPATKITRAGDGRYVVSIA